MNQRTGSREKNVCLMLTPLIALIDLEINFYVSALILTNLLLNLVSIVAEALKALTMVSSLHK